jgi:hypothetical protein
MAVAGQLYFYFVFAMQGERTLEKWMTAVNPSCIHEEILKGQNSGHASYRAAQKLKFSVYCQEI